MYNRRRNFNLRDDTTIFETMRMYQNLNGLFNPFHERLTKLFDFTVAELQWDKAVREALRAERRPANSYNLIRTILNVIFSVERDNRKKAKVSPRTGGDNQLAQVINHTLDYYLYHAGFNKAQKRVFMDKIVARLGCYHLGWKYNGTEDTLGQLFIESIDPREIMYEPNYNDPLWEDASYIMRKHQMSVEEILNRFALNDEEMQDEILREASLFFQQDDKKSKWISKRLKALFSSVYETAIGYSTTQDNLFKNYIQWWDPLTGKFDILELHEKRTERRLLVPDSTRNKVIDITEPYWSEYKEMTRKEPDGFRFDAEIIEKVKNRYSLDGDARVDLAPRRFVTVVIPAFQLKINEQAYPFESKYYVYIPDYCYDTHADPLKLQSVLDDLVDPQADFNKSKSLILELLGRYANKGWILDENAISGLEEDWSNNRIAPYRRVRSGYINMIKPEEGQTISPDLVRMPLELQQLMKVITNADDELRGQRAPNVSSGRHFIAKEQRQAKSFTLILENRDNAQKAVYELALDFIQHYVTTQTVIRITQDNEPKEITLNQSVFSIENNKIVERVINDVDAYKYDIEISDEPYSATAQEERYDKLSDLFNATAAINPKKADALLDIMVEAGNFPESQKILTKWQQLSQPNPQEQQLQQMAAQLQMIMSKLGIEGKKEEVKQKKLQNIEAVQRIKNNARNNALEIVNNKQRRNGKAIPQLN